MATTWRQTPRHPSGASSVLGLCVELGGGDLSFLAVRKRRPRPRSLTGEGGAAGDPSLFDAFVPLLLAAPRLSVNMGHRTLIDRTCLAVPHCSQENFRRKLMERQKRGLDLGVRTQGLFRGLLQLGWPLRARCGIPPPIRA